MTHDEELDLGWRAPTWAQKLADGIRRLLARRQTDRELLLALSERTGRILQQQEKIMATSAEALAAMRANNDKADSLIVYTKDIKAQLDEVLSGVKLPPKVQEDIDAIFAEANSQADENAAAIVANTPPTEPGQ